MSVYWVGDVQGCDAPLGRLLDEIDFSASRDSLFVLGDLVNRGPASEQVLRRLMGMGSAVQCVLGNHDLHLLAVAAGAGRLKPMDTLDGILHAVDRPALLDWLRQRCCGGTLDAAVTAAGGVTLSGVHMAAGDLPVALR